MSTPNQPPRRRIAGEGVPGKESPSKKVESPSQKLKPQRTPRPKPARKSSAKKAAKKPESKKAPPVKPKAPAKKPEPAVRPTKVEPAAPATETETSQAEPKSKRLPEVALPGLLKMKDGTDKLSKPKKQKAKTGEAEKSSTRTKLERPPKAAWKWLAPLLVATVAAVAFAVGPGIFGWPVGDGLLDYSEQRAVVDPSPDPTAAAAEAAETIFTFRFDQLDQHLSDSKALMTDSFGEEFDEIAPALTELAPQRQIVVEAEMRNAAVLQCGNDCSADEANVLVFVDQGRTSQNEPEPTVFANRIVMEMVKQDGEWLVNNIDAL